MDFSKKTTTLQKVYEIIHSEDKEKNKEWIKPCKPEEGKEFSFNPFNIPSNRQKAKTKEYLSKALAFMDMKKSVRFTDKEGGFTVMSVSCKSKRILSMFNGSHKNVSNWIDYLVRIGLIAEYDEVYHFGYKGYSKKYVYSYDTECKIKEFCKENNINKYRVVNKRSIHTIVENFDIANFDKSSVRFNSKLNLLKPDNWTCGEFEDYLTECLYMNYPALSRYQELADIINDKYYSDDFDRQIHFTPKFTWRKGNKCVISIGIRATNPLVSAKKEYDSDDNEWIKHKDDIFKKYGLKYHYDVKSSVPRLTYFLNTSEWLSNDIDLYKWMYERFIKYSPSEKTEWNKETRKIFKDFHMRGYFDTYSMIGGHIKRVISQKVDYKKDEWSDLDYIMKSYKKAIIETIGDLYDSEIFFHESCIYMDVLYELLERGYNVWQVYDEWNTDKEVTDIYEIIENKAVSYLNEYEEEGKESKDIKEDDNKESIHTIVHNFDSDNKEGKNKERSINTIGKNFAKNEYVHSLVEEAMKDDEKEMRCCENCKSYRPCVTVNDTIGNMCDDYYNGCNNCELDPFNKWELRE